jgi:hypothetical protein
LHHEPKGAGDHLRVGLITAKLALRFMIVSPSALAFCGTSRKCLYGAAQNLVTTTLIAFNQLQ